MDFSANRAMPGVLYERLNENGVVIYRIKDFSLYYFSEVDGRK